MNLERRATPNERDGTTEVETVVERPTVVTALPLRRRARERLAQLLGARVVDIREPVDAVDLVLTPACSPQLIGRLKARFDGARVVVVELDDWDFGIELGGPVKRTLRNGADAYLLADSIDELAGKLRTGSRAGRGEPEPSDAPAHELVHELTRASPVDDIIAALLDEAIDTVEPMRRDPSADRPGDA